METGEAEVFILKKSIENQDEDLQLWLGTKSKAGPNQNGRIILAMFLKQMAIMKFGVQRSKSE